MKVGIDIGHGGSDPGAIGPSGLKEKDVNLSVGLILLDLLRQRGFNAIAPRTKDVYVSLKERVKRFNNEKPDLVVSIHVNAFSDPSADYIATFIYQRGGAAEKAAKLVQEQLRLGTKWRGPASPNGLITNNLYILRETISPAILVEMGFITNPRHEQQLRDRGFHQVLAEAIAKGLAAYFGKPAVGEPSNAGKVKIVLNGREIAFDVDPVIIAGRVVAPVRQLAEALGAKVIWDAEQMTVFLEK
ncbi:MAG: N-acetylmuramoyl-L-alanine amidase [Bacillota bacterium]